jgi:hypothetical protein
MPRFDTAERTARPRQGAERRTPTSTCTWSRRRGGRLGTLPTCVQTGRGDASPFIWPDTFLSFMLSPLPPQTLCAARTLNGVVHGGVLCPRSGLVLDQAVGSHAIRQVPWSRWQWDATDPHAERHGAFAEARSCDSAFFGFSPAGLDWDPQQLLLLEVGDIRIGSPFISACVCPCMSLTLAAHTTSFGRQPSTHTRHSSRDQLSRGLNCGTHQQIVWVFASCVGDLRMRAFVLDRYAYNLCAQIQMPS